MIRYYIFTVIAGTFMLLFLRDLFDRPLYIESKGWETLVRAFMAVVLFLIFISNLMRII